MRAALLRDDEQRLCQQKMTARGPSEGVKAELFQRRIALGQVTCRCHPPMVARVQIDSGDTPVWWFPQGHALHRLNWSHLPEVVGIGHRNLRKRGRVRKRDRGDVTDSLLGGARSIQTKSASRDSGHLDR